MPPPEEPLALEALGHRWLIDPALQGWVTEVLGPAAERPGALPGAETIKENRVRSVVRLDGPKGRLYVKRFRVLSLGARLASLVRASPARREWRAMRALAAAGIPVPRPVVLGEAFRGPFLAGSLLATEEARGFAEAVRRLDELRATSDAVGRRALAEGLAPLIARLFRLGVDHPDLHLGNFLVDERGNWLALDLHSVRLRGGELPHRTRRARLAKLAHSFGVLDKDAGPAAREELAWFLAAYAREDGDLGRAEALGAQLLGAAGRVERARLSSRDRRCLVTSTSFVVHGPRGRRVFRRRDVPAQAVWMALDAHSSALVHAHPRGRSRIEVIPSPPDLAPLAGPALVRKLYLFPSLRARLAAFFAPSLALRAWRAARACEVRKVPHPRHFALVAEGILPRAATVLMERIADATMVHVWLEQGLATPRARIALARTLGEVVGRFHAAGLKHRDLAVQNILVRGGEAGWEVWLIDLDEVRVGKMSTRAKLRALTQLADLPAQATRTDRLRFFRAYLRAGGDAVLRAELARWGERGLGRRVGRLLEEKARAKAKRLARGIARPAPTDVSALRS